MERQPPAVLIHQCIHVHHLGLEGVEAVHPNRHQVVEQFIHVAAGMDKHLLARRVDRRIHALEHRVEEALPQLWPHLQAVLLAPVVAKIHRVDIAVLRADAQRLLHLSNVVIADRVEQVAGKIRVVEQVHHKGFQPAHRPGSLVQRKANIEHAVAVAVAGHFFGDVGEKARFQRIRERITLERRTGQHRLAHHADILIHAAVPYHPERILQPVAACIAEEANPVAQVEQVIVEHGE